MTLLPAADNFLFVDSDVSLYSNNLGDMYDALIMPEPAKVEVEIGIGIGIGIVLAVMKFPNSMKILSDPKIWSGGTAASVHTSPYGHGMIPETKSGTRETITVRNGESEKMVKYGTISGIVCDTHGCTVGHTKIQHITHLPKMKFNYLCILSRSMQDGWNLKVTLN
jgi:hypothetical protein